MADAIADRSTDPEMREVSLVAMGILKTLAASAVIGFALQLAASADPAKTEAGPPGQSRATTAPPGEGKTLDAVKARGTLRCGTADGLEGFEQVDAKGHWSGFDVDFCRAVAAAVLGDPDKVDFVPVTTRQRFEALENGSIDLLDRTTTWTLSREAAHHLLFTGIAYYDGQGFLVRRDLKVGSAANLQSDQICVAQDTTTELNLADYFRQRGLAYAAKSLPADEAEQAYAAGKCGAVTTDASALFVLRSKLPHPDDSIILPEIISKEPLGPAVRQGDERWFEIVRWTLIAMIDAEEMGVGQANVDALIRGDNPRIRRLLGVEGNFAQGLGLTADWAYRIIKFVGNYGDVFERNLGKGSPLKIKRGLNDLWTHGGLLYAPPVL